MKITTKEMVTAGLLMAVSVILSFPVFKIMGSIGFYALPAYFDHSHSYRFPLFIAGTSGGGSDHVRFLFHLRLSVD